MKKIKMARGVTLTFEEGCNKYLENCRQRIFKDVSVYIYIKKGFLIGMLTKPTRFDTI